jgi:hypothetical protein
VADPLVTLSDLEASFGEELVREVFSPTGVAIDALSPPARLTRALDVGSRQAESIIMRAWPSAEAVAEVVDGDVAVAHAICGLVMAIGMQGKPHWTGQDAPYRSLKKESDTTLFDLSKGKRLTIAKPGAHPVNQPRVTRGGARARMFAPPSSGSNDNRGGF